MAVLVSNVAPVSSGSPSMPTSSGLTSSTSAGTSSSSRSSRSLCEERVATRSRPATLAADRREGSGLGREQLAEARVREVEQLVQRRAVERLALGRALELDVRAGIRPDDVEVDLGPRVLGVVEVEVL